MAGSAFLQYSLVTCAQAQTLLEKGGAKDMNYGVSCRYFVRPGSRGSIKERSGTCLPLGIRRIWPSPYFKAFHAALAVAPERIASENDSQVQQEKENQTSAMFPDGFESLLMEVCDETDVAELKIKVGNFEMHMRRNINTTKGPLSIASPLTPPPVPSKPMVDSVPATAISAPSSPERKFSSPFITKLSSSKTSKFGLVEAAGDEGLLLVTSPKVGLFRRGRVVKGKSGRPLCEEGQSIKKGQVVCYLDQLGTQQPVTSEVSGEIVKVLWNDGEPVGYGDPLIAVLPSFDGIE